MSANLAETIQKNLGYPELKKINLNTDMVESLDKDQGEPLLGQATIPAILVSIYKYTRSDKGAENVLCGDISTNWLNEFLSDHKKETVEKIAAYVGTSKANAYESMKNVADEAVNLIHSSNPLTVNDVKDLLAAEKNNMLLFLPPLLQMGELINDNTLDDDTHKMEGPVSSLMNALGNIFSGSEKEERK